MKRRFQFSLRTLFVVVTVVALLAAAWPPVVFVPCHSEWDGIDDYEIIDPYYYMPSRALLAIAILVIISIVAFRRRRPCIQS